MFLKDAREALEREALEREIEVTRSVFSPAFRAVRAVVRDERGLRVAFELVEGEPIVGYLARAPHELPRITLALLRALRTLHHAGFAHGDLKPEHVILDRRGTLRLIDLGLSARLGTTARGGTHGYLAPELLAGEPLRVASDLYALGATLRALPGLDAAPAIAGLAQRCMQPTPSERPSSTGAALVALGALGGREPIELGIPASLREAMRALSPGSITVIDVPRGGGRSALLARLGDELGARGGLMMTLPTEGVPLATLADLLGLRGTDPAHRSARAALALSEVRRPFAIDDADRLDDDGRASLLAGARALSVAQRGALVVIGADPPLREALLALGGRVSSVPALDAHAISRLLSSSGARSDAATASQVLSCTEGRAGWVARLALRLGETPEASVADVWHAMETFDAKAIEAPPADPLERAESLLRAGAPLRARALLDHAPKDAASTALAVRIALAAGKLDVAESACREAIAWARPEERVELSLTHARTLERLGRHAEARALGTSIADSAGTPVSIARALSIAAQSALALGDPHEADALAARGLAALPDASEAELSARLCAIRSDAALRANDPSQALAHAAAARRHAERCGEPLAMAHAIARTAAAYALSGEPQRARVEWRLALGKAEESGDVTALPPYVMNLATADHAAYEIADAMAGYERAASLAARLGRTGSRVAALTNLGGLLGTIGAETEALTVLAEAEGLADQARIPLYAAQAKLLRAEVLRRRDPGSARQEIDAARAAFEAANAPRQVLEARLVAAEIELQRDRPERALEEIGPWREGLGEAGLGARTALLLAHVAKKNGDRETARREADRAASEARRAGDRDLSAQALLLAAQIHAELGTGASEGLLAEARTLIGELAARVPPGLRDAFLSTPERASVMKSAVARASVASPRGLSEASRRLLGLLSRVLLEEDEQRVLETALDEAVTLTRAERAFLLLRRAEGKRPEVVAARNLDKETIQKSRFRWSRSVAERVLLTGEPLVTASATEDPALKGARSVLDLGLRSILTVPVRTRTGVIGALYLDHRFETGRFDDDDRELLQALADVIGLALENGRLHREARDRQHDLERTSEALLKESAEKDVELSRLSDALQKGTQAIPETSGIVGSAEPLRRALDVAAKVARSEIAVLIEGESGTGKELFARFVHDKSQRSHGPWVALNCGALPETILESELFGHDKGAFTGAVRDHLGAFRAANGGTVFLDEIGELPPSAQARLLRVLQEREVQPVGGRRAVPIDVRVISATNRHLEAEVAAGRFRQDLYFRLVGVAITLPPLRERRQDIPAIATRLLVRIAQEPGMREVSLSRRASAALIAHDWPGNVRELEQALRRAVAVSEGDTLEPSDLLLSSTAETSARRDAHRALDRRMLEEALRNAGGNRTRAAEALGITRVTLHRAIKRLGVLSEAKPGRPRAR